MKRAGALLLAAPWLALACVSETAVAPAVPAATIEQVADGGASWRAALETEAAKGFVLVPREGVKWSTAEEVRVATRVTPSEEVVVHEVIADLGDRVAVRPLTRGEDHCHRGRYASVKHWSVQGFVHKRDLEIVLADDLMIEGPDDTGYEVRAGARVRDEGETRVVMVEGIRLPLPATAKLALSYGVPARRFAPPPVYYDSLGPTGGPEPTFVLSGATLRLGEQTISGAEVADHAELSIARSVGGKGAERMVALQSGCLSLRALVAAEHLRQGYERGGVGAIGYGGGGLGSLGSRQAPPPPKEHYAPEGTPLYWKGSKLVAGKLSAAVRTYPLDEPACMAVDQGFIDNPEVCFAPGEVRRDCREACAESGACEASRDGSRCVAKRSEHCRASSQCEHHGACSLQGERCVVAGDGDCADSLYCTLEPHACMAHEGKCVVTPNPECANRPACKLEGRCTADELGACVAGESDQCAASAACAQTGNCAAYGGSCAPATTAHCQNSALCAAEGRCALVGRECAVASDLDCRKSEACKDRGDCVRLEQQSMGFLGADPPKVFYCGPGSDEDCRQASRCKGTFACSLDASWGRNRCVFR